MAEAIGVSKELDLAQREISRPSYTYTQVPVQNGLSTFSVSPASQFSVTFNLTAGLPYNLAKSYLQFTWSIPVANGTYGYIYQDFVPYVDNLLLQTEGGVTLAQINNCQMASKIMLKPNTKFHDFIRKDLFTEYLTPCYSSAPIRYDPASNGVVDGVFPYLEPNYLAGVAGAAGAAGSLTQTVLIPLSMFKGTILALDKDLYFPRNVRLILNLAATNTVGFTAASPIVDGAAVAFTATAQYSNLYLYLCQETNPLINAALQAKVDAGGLRYLTDFLYTNVQNVVGSSQNMQVRYNKSNGQRLKKIYFSRVIGNLNPATNANQLYDTSNQYAETVLGGAAAGPFGHSTNQFISQFYSTLDGIRLQQLNVTTHQVVPVTTSGGAQNFDAAMQGYDYMLMRQNLKGTIIYNTYMYAYNWFWMENFDQGEYDRESQSVRTGLPLEKEVRWDIFVTYSGSFNINSFAFAVVEREVIILPGGTVTIV